MSVDPNVLKLPVAALALTEHDALPAGTRFGEFEIIRALGVGGFGIVYLAQDHSLERQVALKEYMPAALAARGAGPMITIRAGAFAETYAVGLRSFINEARLLARFDHPSLVKVYRFWEDNGTAYMVMPYLQGRTLRDARRTLGRAPDEAWIRAVLDPMLDALELLHREGVFHRDVAPDNILLPPEGVPMLLDFGAARRVINNRNDTLTAILKPSYAPIEQYAEMASLRQGPWTDIYALGAVLHFLVFGAPPAPATARAVQLDAEPIELRNAPGISPRFLRVMNWMLGVRPLERPQDVGTVRAALAGQIDPPDVVRHESTRPMVVAVPATSFESTTVDSGYAPTRVSPHAEPTRVSPRAEPTRVSPRAAAPPAGMPAAGAPLRSTPPGLPPPAYVPPPRPPRTAAPTGGPAAPLDSPPTETIVLPVLDDMPTLPPPGRSRRWPAWAVPNRRAWAGGLGAAVVGAALLWQFASLLARPPDGAASRLAAAPHATGPSALPMASASASVPASAGPVGVPDAPAAPQLAAAPAEVPPVAVPGPMSVPASVAAGDAAGVREPDGRKARVTHRASAGSRSLAASSMRYPATAREACGDRSFISLAMCLDRQCERPRYRQEPSCERMLAAKRRRSGEY